MQVEVELSQRRACGLIELYRATCRYRKRRSEDQPLRVRLRELAEGEGEREGSSVKWSCGFDGSRSWFLYLEGAKRLNGGIATGMRLAERVQEWLSRTQRMARW